MRELKDDFIDALHEILTGDEEWLVINEHELEGVVMIKSR